MARALVGSKTKKVSNNADVVDLILDLEVIFSAPVFKAWPKSTEIPRHKIVTMLDIRYGQL
jgi:hypothetical protein